MFASYKTDVDAIRHVRSAIPIVMTAICASVVMIAAAPRLVDLILGADYSDSASILRLAALAAIPSIASQPLASLLQARGDDKFVGTIGLSTSIAALVMTALLCTQFDAAASPMASGVAATLLLLALLRRVRRMSRTGLSVEA
jgi:O-antigen/teichoic acid export membrane protein